MERLTKSPYVINMFGYCGMSVVTEYAGQNVAQVVDALTPLKKLELAKMIAQGVADIHGIDDQVSLVHNDLNLANIVIGNKHGRPLINDFNIAVLMMKRNDTGEACTFTSHFPNPQWRGPEEQVDENGKTSKFLTEKVDIYALGNVMFRFAVGHSPWKHADGRSLTPEEKREIAKLKTKNGALPDVPDEVQHSENPATKALLSIMRECYRHRPELRPSAKEIVDQLQSAIDEYIIQLQIAIEKYKTQLKESKNNGGEVKFAEKENVHGRKLTVKKKNHNKKKNRHGKVNSS
jgi:serine/threonine protein kinase